LDKSDECDEDRIGQSRPERSGLGSHRRGNGPLGDRAWPSRAAAH